MKKIIILAIGVILSMGSVLAQQPRRGGGRQFSTKDRVEMLKKELKLSDEQTEQVTVIYDEFQKKMNAGEKKDRRQMRGEMDSLNMKVEQILNDEQKEAYKKLQEKRQERQRGGNRGGSRR